MWWSVFGMLINKALKDANSSFTMVLTLPARKRTALKTYIYNYKLPVKSLQSAFESISATSTSWFSAIKEFWFQPKQFGLSKRLYARSADKTLLGDFTLTLGKFLI
jgi:hypothetical protein